MARGKTGATAERPKTQPMKFTAVLKDVDVKAGAMKTSGYSTKQTFQGGEIVLQLSVKRPTIPEPPEKPYELRYVVPPQPVAGPGAFVEPAQQEGETDAAYKARRGSAKKEHDADVKSHAAAVKRYEDAKQHRAIGEQKWEALKAAHARKAEAVAAQFNAYAQLAGIGALAGGLPVVVQLTPDSRAMAAWLPGFAPAPLAAGLGEVPQLEAPAIDEDDGFDDEDDE